MPTTPDTNDVYLWDFVPYDSITLGKDRQRQFYSLPKIMDLAESIQDQDLIQPIVLREHSNELVAGGRRYKAMGLLLNADRPFRCMGCEVSRSSIPVLRLPDREFIEYYEAELAENVHREDLTWQEEAAARARLHEYRKSQNPGQTIRDTAAEIYGNNTPLDGGSSITRVSTDLNLAKHLADPEISSAKTRADALKLIKIKATRERQAMLAEQAQASPTPHTMITGDSMHELTKLPSAMFDCLLTDPPYGVGAHTFGDQTAITHNYDDSHGTWLHLIEALAKESARVCKPSAHAYVFCDIRRFAELSHRFTLAGWKVWDRPLIWYKGNQGTLPRPNHGPRCTYEAILFASLGDRPTLKVGHDVLVYSTGDKNLHAAEKPVDLYRELLSRSVEPGQCILDPFAGSGTIFPAANAALCTATGIELEVDNAKIAWSRIDEGRGGN